MEVNMKRITVYFIPGCPYCKSAKEFIKSKEFEFEEINVEDNSDAAEDIIERTGQSGFPVIEINGELIIGFDEQEITEKLAK
jgi:glutaredoxin 3